METASLWSAAEPLADNLIPESLGRDSLGHDLDIEAIVRRVVAGKQPIARRIERRRDTRYAFPYPLTLLPLEAALRGERDAAISVLGRHLTIHGVDFYSTSPIKAREVICQFHAIDGAPSLVLELQWCRHNAQGWFENGGKFLRVWKEPALGG